MKEKAMITSRYLPVIATLSALFLVLLCCGEFARVEMILKEQRERIIFLENKMTTSIQNASAQTEDTRNNIQSTENKMFENLGSFRMKMSMEDQLARIRHKRTASKNPAKETAKTKDFHLSASKVSLQFPGKTRPGRRLDIKRNTSDNNKVSKHLQNHGKLLKIIQAEVNKALLAFCERKYPVFLQGPPGPPGKTGMAGPQGLQGQKGAHGKKGAQGITEENGKQGIQGPPGLKGDPGDVGPPGRQGMPGPKGESGETLQTPNVQISTPMIIINENEPAMLTCTASGIPRPVITWSKISDSLPVHSAVSEASGSLIIDHVTSNDAGIYICKATSILGTAEKYVTLQVNYRPMISLEKGPIKVVNGHNVTLPKCHVSGHPKPRITWSKVSGNLSQSYHTIEDGELALFNVNKNDTGHYTCKAENSLGMAEAQCVVVVVGLPVFIEKPADSYHVQKGSNLEIKCSAEGDPKPIMSWTKNKKIIYSTTDQKGHLVLQNIQTSDIGDYLCHATSCGVAMVTAKTRVSLLYRDCAELYQSGERRNGVYTIQPTGETKFKVYCDMTTDGGGWTVIQRRTDGTQDFYLNWEQYKTGFGNLTNEFWLGNNFIHLMTKRTGTILRVELEDWGGIKVYAKYGSFRIGNEASKYRLHVGVYSGTAGDSLSQHNNMAFTTKDSDNDKHVKYNMAAMYTAAWWYYDDYSSSLNGVYGRNVGEWKGINWVDFKWHQTLKHTEMKFRPQSF